MTKKQKQAAVLAATVLKGSNRPKATVEVQVTAPGRKPKLTATADIKAAPPAPAPVVKGKGKGKTVTPPPAPVAPGEKIELTPNTGERSGQFIQRYLIAAHKGEVQPVKFKVLGEFCANHWRQTTTAKDVSWNAWHLRQKGILPPARTV